MELRLCPQRQRGGRRNRSTSGEHLRHVVTQTGPLSKPLKDPEQTERRRRENLTTSSFPMLWEHLRHSGGINIIFWFTLNLPTHWGRLRQILHPEDKTPRHKQSNVVYAVQCSQGCTDLYIGETKQPLHKPMAQHWRANSSGQDSAVHLHLEENNHSFEENNVKLLSREGRWQHVWEFTLLQLQQVTVSPTLWLTCSMPSPWPPHQPLMRGEKLSWWKR